MYDKNIPVPKTGSTGRKTKFNFVGMEIGDSTFIPFKEESYKDFMSFRTTVVVSAKRQIGNGFKVVTAEVFEDDQRGLRVWKSE